MPSFRELIIAARDWRPPEPHPQETKATGLGPKRFYTERVGLRIGFEESELRTQIKAAGGLWNPKERLWFVPVEEARRLGLIQGVVTQ